MTPRIGSKLAEVAPLSTLRAGVNDEAVFATDVFAAGGFSIFGDAGCASDTAGIAAAGIATGATADDTAALAASTGTDAALWRETASVTVPGPDVWPDCCPAVWAAP